MTRIRRNPEREIRQMFSDAPPHTVRLEASFTVDDFRPMSDVGVIIVYSVALGIAAGLLVWIGTATRDGRANAEAAGMVGSFFVILGMVAVPLYLTINRRQTVVADFAPAGQQPTEPAPFIETLNQGHRREIVLFPAGWDIATMRRYAAHAQTADGYDIAYNKRPAWVTEDMLKAFRLWLAERGYGTEQDATRPWLWYPEGIEFMDGLTTSPLARPTTAPPL